MCKSSKCCALFQSFGDGSVAQFVLGREQYGTFLTVNWAWGLAVAMGVWASGGVSGKHGKSFQPRAYTVPTAYVFTVNACSDECHSCNIRTCACKFINCQIRKRYDVIKNYISSHLLSGGHINPAVSLTMAILGRLTWFKLLVYMLAQYLGAFVASACVYGVYYGMHSVHVYSRKVTYIS